MKQNFWISNQNSRFYSFSFICKIMFCWVNEISYLTNTLQLHLSKSIFMTTFKFYNPKAVSLSTSSSDKHNLLMDLPSLVIFLSKLGRPTCILLTILAPWLLCVIFDEIFLCCIWANNLDKDFSSGKSGGQPLTTSDFVVWGI